MQLELTSREVTIILQALAELPYKESAALIRKIVWQDSQEKSKQRRCPDGNRNRAPLDRS